VKTLVPTVKKCLEIAVIVDCTKNDSILVVSFCLSFGHKEEHLIGSSK
jgi:hypothetical protein